MSPEGKPIQVNASALQAAAAQNTVTVMSPEGKPIQVNAGALQAAAAQNAVGTHLILYDNYQKDYIQELSLIQEAFPPFDL